MPNRLLTAAALATFAVAPALAGAPTPAHRCESGASAALVTCTQTVANKTHVCYLASGAPCPGSEPGIVRALAKLQTTVDKKCPDAATVQGAGFGALMTPATLVARLQEACRGEPATLAARTFGGPQGALLVGASNLTKNCLDTAYHLASVMMKKTVRAEDGCIKKAHAGGTCKVADTGARVTAAETAAETAIGAACPTLKDITGLDAPTYVARASAQARCMTAAGHADSGPLTLDCGPRADVPVPPRGQWVQVVLDEAVWGTRCGKGGQYAFWLRLAPAGSPVENVITDQQGGGVCIFESDCNGVSPGLFTATDEGQPGGGYLSTDSGVNPLSDWTMLFMPYCTQDVHIGGGLASVFPSVTVYRYGAINVRAALRYLRDVLWAEMDATDPDGYRPDKLKVFFGGESAGGFGVSYNYHYPVDELRWANTTGAPDSGLGLDNGTAVSVRTLGQLITTETNPYGWGTRAYQPPYCLGTNCAVVPELLAATAPRLKATPWQQILTLSNQIDGTQVSTTFFPSNASFINAVRTAYCANKGKTGLHYFLSAQTAPFHTMLRTDSRYTGLVSGGIVLRDFVADAMANPDAVTDRLDEGTLVTDYPGVNPIACP